MYFLYHYFFGYVLLAVKGEYSERILNICACNNISVWKIKRKKDKLLFCIFARDFRKLLHCGRGMGTSVHIEKKAGIPFLYNKAKRRPGILIGAVLFFALIIYLSGFVWNININCEQKIDRNEVMTACKKIGIYEGKRIKSIDFENAAVLLALELPDVSWASVNVEGTVVSVNINKAVKSKKDDTPCNIKANCDGMILSVKATKGSSVVKVGDIVTRGDLLISGIVQNTDGSSKLVHSAAKVTAQTKRSFCEYVPFCEKTNKFSGIIKRRNVLCFFGKEIPLYISNVCGEYDYLINEKKIIAGHNYIPVYLKSVKYIMKEKKNETRSKDEAIALAKSRIDNNLKKLKSPKIISFSDSVEQTSNGINLTRSYILQENICTQDNLIINSLN